MAQHPHAGGLGTLLWYYQYTDSRVTISPTVEFTFNAHEDIMGSASYYTKQTGAVYEEHIYDAWGGVRWSTGHGVNDGKTLVIEPNYTGHSYDPILKIYHGEARFYDAKTRQWMASDPIKSGLNWYQYVESNPTNYVDYNGLWAALVGVSGAAALGIRLEGSFGIAFDDDGNVAIVVGGGIGGGTPTLAGSGYLTYSYGLDTIDKLLDKNVQSVAIGTSIGIVGVDIVTNNAGVDITTGSVGYSVVPVDFHATIQGSTVFLRGNIEDTYGNLLAFALQPYRDAMESSLMGYYKPFGCSTKDIEAMLDFVFGNIIDRGGF